MPVCVQARGGDGAGRGGASQAHVQARAPTQMSLLKYDLQFLKTGPLIGLELAKQARLADQ